MQVTKVQKVVVSFAYGTTAGELAAALSGVPAEAKVSVEHYKGDQRDPAYTTLTFSWGQ